MPIVESRGEVRETSPTAGYLAFALGPVQPFIATARTVRDLWTGSTLLSWMASEAMRPIREHYGSRLELEDLMVVPSLRHTPLPMLERRNHAEEHGREAAVAHEGLPVLGLPNRFMARLPEEPGLDGYALARACEAAARQAWQDLAEEVRSELDKQLSRFEPNWDERWHEQVASFFEIRSCFLPAAECTDAVIARLMEVDSRKVRDRERLLMDLCGRLLETRRAVAHIPSVAPRIPSPPKCMAMGTYEQMGPADLKESAAFWSQASRLKEGAPAWNLHGVNLRKGERLCAVALVKRFAAPVGLNRRLGVDQHRRIPDTATIAAADWLAEAGVDVEAIWHEEKAWNGQWLHWSGRDSGDEERPPKLQFENIQGWRKTHGYPPAYYAVLVLDGDEMGKWLRGEKPEGGEPLPPEELSRRLGRLATKVVPPIVSRYRGTLIYSGGDDVLALLPARSAPACARELREAFSGPEGLHPQATASAGIAVVHYKDDLRASLDAARGAEHAAKQGGRDTLHLRMCPRSGGHSSAGLPWPMIPVLERWVRRFADEQASDRWAYHLQSELPVLRGLELDAMKAEIRRQMNRSERPTREAFGDGEAEKAGDRLAEDFDLYVRLRRNGSPENMLDLGAVLQDFVTLCQAASFLVRGRSDR